ncbi:MAG: hypothetical protein ACRDNB_07960 [Gaiellaceae bacterium]
MVVVLGVMFGSALAVTSAYRVDFASFPPKLTARESPTYSAGTQLEVTSPVEPYYRSAVDVPVVTPATQDEEDPAPNLVEQDEPTVQTLIAAANYYPLVIEGDEVKALRERLYGAMEGEVQASAIGALITPNRQEPGRLPFIQIVVTSDSPQNAVKLAQTTADAFIRFVRLQQERRGIRPAQRLIVKQLRKPAQTFEIGGTSMNLPILIFVALAGVAVALAFLLDRMFPRRPAPAAVPADDELVRHEDREQKLVASGREA